MSKPNDNLMLKIFVPGWVAIFTLLAMLGTGAYAIAHEPLAWWALAVETFVLFGMGLRLYFTMRDMKEKP